MLVNKFGMSIGECANITGQSGGAHKQWRLSNGCAVNKNQQGIAYRIVGGSGEETSVHSSQYDESRAAKAPVHSQEDASVRLGCTQKTNVGA